MLPPYVALSRHFPSYGPWPTTIVDRSSSSSPTCMMLQAYFVQLSRGRLPFHRPHLLSAVAAHPLSPGTTDAIPLVDDTQVPAPALGAVQPAFILVHLVAEPRALNAVLGRRRFLSAFNLAELGHGYLSPTSSENLVRFTSRFGLTDISAVTQPCMDAATAQPTRQSSQWLSGLDGLGRHSWTVRPWPAVIT